MESTTNGHQHPYLTAGWFSKLTFWWINGLFRTAQRRPLVSDDIFGALPWFKAEESGSRFERHWNNISKEEKDKHGSLLKYLFLHFKKRLAFALFIELLMLVLRFMNPILVAWLIRYLDGSGRTSLQEAYIYMAILVISGFALVPLHCHCFVNLFYTAMGMRTICTTLIYKKVLTMSSSTYRKYPAGHIVTLMSTDAENFHQCLSSIHALIFSPLTLIAFVWLEAAEHGISIIFAIIAIILHFIARYWLGKYTGRVRLIQQQLTDKRVQFLNELITAMRVIKMYCWEHPFAEKAKRLRRSETQANMKRMMLNLNARNFCTFFLNVTAFITLIPSYLLGNEIHPETTVRLIGWLKAMNIIIFILAPTGFGDAFETIGGCERIKKFLMCDDIDQEDLALNGSSSAKVRLTDADATWDPNINDSKQNLGRLTLKNINFNSEPGELLGITGHVGSGKTSLLMAILGELKLLHGERQVLGSIAYVPQEAWILSDTVQGNIILDSELNQEKYKSILKACALDEDIKRFPEDDLTHVGERGLSLSGGQKARLNLARALYQDADIYLLDDPLAAVDGKVGEHIFKECICGLMKTKLCIMVTHNLNYLPFLDRVVVMDKGCIVQTGNPTEIVNLLPHSMDADQGKNEPVITKCGDDMEDNAIKETIRNTTSQNPERPPSTIYQEKSVKLETKKIGNIGFTVYKKYLEAGHGKVFVPLGLFFTCLYQIARLGGDWMFSRWNTSSPPLAANETFVADTDVYNMWMPTIQGMILLAMIVFSQLSASMLALLVVTAGRHLYNKMFQVLIRAPMYFFETNESGAILNRFSRDTGFMDIVLLFSFFFFLQTMSTALTYAIFSCVLYPWMFLVAFCVVIITGLFLRFSLSCIRDVKRIETSRRSPTYSHLSATLQGLYVIRALRKEKYFMSMATTFMDSHSASWYTYLSAQAFFGICIDTFVSLFCGIYIILSVVASNSGAEEAGVSGLSFVYIFGLLSSLQFGLQSLAEAETIMTSVERIQQFGSIEQEAPEHTDVRPPPGWPHRGAIAFTNTCLTYRGQNTPALGPLTVNIKPGEKVGVIGRTGAGKTSLFVSLLRMVEPTGSIKIDGLEITKLGLTDLRSNISVIPQDPVLFSGTLRVNLDPFEEFEDDLLWENLKQVQLHVKVSSLSEGLYAEMGEAGSNFSVGEKQLLCMARALMRKKKIIIVDEATSNVDNRTDAVIQNSLSTDFADSTVITIAHRLNTVITYDKIMVFDDGRLVESNHPHLLLQDDSGMFSQMVMRLGDSLQNHLRESAKKSFFTAKEYQHIENGHEKNPVTENEEDGHINPVFVPDCIFKRRRSLQNSQMKTSHI